MRAYTITEVGGRREGKETLHWVYTTTFVTCISPKVKSLGGRSTTRFEDKELNYSLVYVGSHGSNYFSLHGGPK